MSHKKPKIGNFVIRRWKQKKTSTIKECYYHRGPSPERELTPLGSDYKAALAKWAEIEGKKIEPPKNGTVADIYQQYMEWANKPKVSKLAPRTIEDRRYYWGEKKDSLTGQWQLDKEAGKLEQIFGNSPIDSLQPAWMLSYFEARTSQASAKKEIKFLSVLCNWAKARGKMTTHNPTESIMHLLDVDEGREIYVYDDWFNLVHKHGTPLVKDALDASYMLANRPAETSRAMMKDINTEEVEIQLAKTRRSGLKVKHIPITPALADYINRQRLKNPRSLYLVSDENGQQFKPNGSKFREDFKQARDMAEIEAKEKNIKFTRFQLRDIRAKAATDIARDHGIEAARLMLGHTTQKQTADYIRSIKGAAKNALKAIFGEAKNG